MGPKKKNLRDFPYYINTRILKKEKAKSVEVNIYSSHTLKTKIIIYRFVLTIN